MRNWSTDENRLKKSSDAYAVWRDEIVLVLPEKGPITWNVAFLEVENETPLGADILKKLAELEIV